MNRILLEADEIAADRTVRLTGRRSRHIQEVLRADPGSTIKIGIVNGDLGNGRVVMIEDDATLLEIEVKGAPPPPLFDLLLALPRPKVMKRLWAQLAALGARRIVLVNAYRVERAYFDTHWIREESYRPLLLEGLEQAGTTQLPEVILRKRFKPFAEDELDSLLPGRTRWVGHPGGAASSHAAPGSGPPVLAIGPEGGWTDYELRLLEDRAFQRVSLGPRTLRTDTAVVALAAICALRHGAATRAL